MKRVVIRRPGSFDRLELESCPDPIAGPGEVCVQTEAIGINFADCVIRMGLYSSALRYVGWPITPGFEFAGTVSQTGEGVRDLPVGSKVFGVTRFGGYSTHVCAPRSQIFRLPAGLTPLQAATFPTVFLTAYYALTDCARLRPGSKVLIHSAAGGVGSAAVQIAKNLGCFVVGVVGAPHKVAAVQSLGADVVIDKSSTNLWQAARACGGDGYQAILEANGTETLRQSYAHLRPTGRLVIYGFQTMLTRGSGRRNWLKLAWNYLRLPRFNPLFMTDANKGVVAFNLSYLFHENDVMQEAMGHLLTALEAGRLKPAAVTPFPLDQVRAAHEALQSGQTVGKIALVP